MHKKNLTRKTERKSASAEPEVLKHFKPNLKNDTLEKQFNFITLFTSFSTTDMIPLPSKVKFVLQPNFSSIEKLRNHFCFLLTQLKLMMSNSKNLHIKKMRKPKILRVTKSEK